MVDQVRKKVLIADEDTSLPALNMPLPWKISTAKTSTGALMILEKGEFDCVVSSSRMPHIEDGLEVIRYALGLTIPTIVLHLGTDSLPEDVTRGCRAVLNTDSIQEIITAIQRVFEEAESKAA